MVVGLAALSVGYALWSKTLTIDGTVNTGNVALAWSPVEFMGDSEPTAKDEASSISCVINGDSLCVTLTGAYPSIWYACSFDVTSTGSVPVHFENIVWDNPAGIDVVLSAGKVTQGDLPIAPAQATPVAIDFNAAGEQVQLHKDQSQDLTLWVHFSNDDDLDQDTLGAASFTGTLVGGQWNEVPAP